MRPVVLYIAGGAVLIAYVYSRLASGKNSAAVNVGMNIGSGAVDLASGLTTGVVETIGQQFGIPQTNQTECEQALNEGRTWDASFSCPAGQFIKSFFN